jgi:hypothetical protein
MHLRNQARALIHRPVSGHGSTVTFCTNSSLLFRDTHNSTTAITLFYLLPVSLLIPQTIYDCEELDIQRHSPPANPSFNLAFRGGA